MTAPPDDGLAHIATYLRQLAARDDLRPDARTLCKHANDLDRADRELRHLRALPAPGNRRKPNEIRLDRAYCARRG